MSRSDSESLDDEFESADEGGIKGEDIDLAELGLDSDDDNLETDTNKILQSNTNETISKQVLPENKTQTKQEPQIITTTTQSLPDQLNENFKVEEKILKDEFSCEGDDEVNKLLQEMEHKNQVKIENISTSPESPIKKDTTDAETNKNLGWDDTELDDLDDDESLNITPSKQNETKQEVKPRPQLQYDMISSSKSVDSIRNNTEQSKVKPSSSGWGWASSFLSTATSSVANVAGQFGTGLNTVLETVEATIGAPDPVQLALAAKKAKESDQNEVLENETSGTKSGSVTNDNKNIDFNDWNSDDQEWFTITSLASKGSQLVVGSLNVLETVGKKTFETISERDPNLKITRDLLNKVPKAIPTAQKPNLSQLLREAQQAREERQESLKLDPTNRSINNQVEKLTFGLFFDEFKGAANLEALEMLSQQAQVKLETSLVQMKKNSKLNMIIKQLDNLFKQDNLNDDLELDLDEQETNDMFSFLEDFNKLTNSKNKSLDYDRFELLVNDYADELNFNIKLDKLISAFQTSVLSLKEMSDPQELFNESIKNFALITAKLVESYQKLAETVLLDQQNKNKSLTTENIVQNAQYLFQITKLCIRSLTLLADDYSKKCLSNGKDNNVKQINQITTDIYLEASNSSTYMGDTYLLFNSIFKSLLID